MDRILVTEKILARLAYILFYTGIKQWNALPSATQLLTNKQDFKCEVKKLL